MSALLAPIEFIPDTPRGVEAKAPTPLVGVRDVDTALGSDDPPTSALLPGEHRKTTVDYRRVNFFFTKNNLADAFDGILQDPNLGAHAARLLMYLRRQSPTFKCSMTLVRNYLRVGERAAEKVMHNLRKAGYADLRLLHDGAKVVGSEYVFYDSPQAHLICPHVKALNDAGKDIFGQDLVADPQDKVTTQMYKVGEVAEAVFGVSHDTAIPADYNSVTSTENPLNPPAGEMGEDFLIFCPTPEKAKWSPLKFQTISPGTHEANGREANLNIAPAEHEVPEGLVALKAYSRTSPRSRPKWAVRVTKKETLRRFLSAPLDPTKVQHRHRGDDVILLKPQPTDRKPQVAEGPRPLPSKNRKREMLAYCQTDPEAQHLEALNPENKWDEDLARKYVGLLRQDRFSQVHWDDLTHREGDLRDWLEEIWCSYNQDWAKKLRIAATKADRRPGVLKEYCRKIGNLYLGDLTPEQRLTPEDLEFSEDIGGPEVQLHYLRLEMAHRVAAIRDSELTAYFKQLDNAREPYHPTTREGEDLEACV